MNRKSLPALLLALFMCITLLPLPGAYAEETGSPVYLRFTSNRAGDTALVTLIDDAGNPVLPLSGEEAAYLLSPGTYSYYLIDPAGQAELIPVTALVLDGTSPLVEIPLRGAQASNPAPAAVVGTQTETHAETQTEVSTAGQTAPEEDMQAMPVVFQYAGAVDFSGLTITSFAGMVMQPYYDAETGQTQYQNYLLPPGQYSYLYHDPAGIMDDRQGSFSVTNSGMQFVDLVLSDDVIKACFSATVVNPLYENVIPAEYIPAPAVSPEESLAELLSVVDELSSNAAQHRMTAVYGAGPDSISETYDAAVTYETAEAAGAALKRSLLQRQTQITIRVKTHIKPTDEIWWDMCQMIYNEAIRHTGEPTEGDYMRYEYGGVKCNGSATGTVKSGVYYYQFVYSPLYFTTLAQESELDNCVSAVLNSISPAGKSDEQIIRAIYQYLCDNVRYVDAADSLDFTAYNALVKGHAACQGFSVAFYRLCLELGVDARIVTSEKMRHAWNIASPDGKHYYALDATWDVGKKPAEWKYCLCGRNSWQAEHSVGDEFADGSFAAYTFPNEDYSTDTRTDTDAGTGAVIHSVSVLFDGLLRIKYYFILPESLLKEDGAAVQFSRGGNTVSTVPLSEGKTEGEYICFYCSVNAEDIGVPIQTRIVKKDGSFETICSGSGTMYPNGFFFSPMEYARQMKNSASTTTMRALAQALEDYGIAAQNYFKKENETLRDEVKAVKAEDLEAWTIKTEGEKPQGFKGASISVMFEADNSLRVYLQFEDDVDLGHYSFKVDGQSAALREKEGGVFYLNVENIGANELDTQHSFTLTYGEGSPYTITASVLGYAKTAIERGSDTMADLGRALYLYNRAAENYFKGSAD